MLEVKIFLSGFATAAVTIVATVILYEKYRW